ncbi:MAG: peptidoglycan-binding protein [Candidatus Taylorbacteria bacterium]|nr:peptidoglycan-binding protein [Candidatus Taylorbacteria bacterium]
MRRILGVVILLLLPLLVFAGYADVTLTTDAQFTVNGVTLTVSGSSGAVERVRVDGTALSIDLQYNSSLTVRSSARKRLQVNDNDVVSSTACASSYSEIVLKSSYIQPKGVSIEPQSDACDAGSSSSSSSSNSTAGSGGSVSVESRPQIVYPDGTIVYLEEKKPDEVPLAIPVQREEKKIQPRIFLSNFGYGATSADVRKLQELFAQNPDIYPEAVISGYYGPLTTRAVERFQTKHGIVSGGSPETTGFGFVGPRTRAKLNEIFSGNFPGQMPNFQPESQAVFSKRLVRGISDPDVKMLQVILNRDRDTSLAPNGDGSPGQETDYFGVLTEAAVRKFQEKYGIAGPGALGYGEVGPNTRAKLNELR